MIRLIKDNKGNILLTAMVVAVGVMLGLAVFGAFHGAEAILGESGNVTDNNNPHNLSKGSSGVQAKDETRICVFCHTAHGAKSDADLINAPLWNHSLSSEAYKVLAPDSVVNSVDKFTFIANAGIVNMLSSPGAPDGTSRLCLGCHDGTVAIGSVGSELLDIEMAASACLDPDGSLASTCSSYIGNDLTTKHVVSIPMNDSLIAASLANCGSGGQTTRVKYPWDGGTMGSVVLLRPTLKTFPAGGSYGVQMGGSPGMPAAKYKAGYSYGVQCSSCHDPHDWSASQGSGYKFVVAPDLDSLCAACHTTAGCP